VYHGLIKNSEYIVGPSYLSNSNSKMVLIEIPHIKATPVDVKDDVK